MSIFVYNGDGDCMFIKNPNLPVNDVTLCISNVEIPGVKTICPPNISSLTPPLSFHADLGICHLGENTVICPPCTISYYKEILTPLGFYVISGESPVLSTYPFDCAYNVAILYDKVILNSETCDKILLFELKKRHYKIIDVKQGYSKCTTAIISKNAVITEDAGIFKACEKEGINALLTEPGVNLSGFKNGFLGGASGLIGNGQFFINGNLEKLKDFKKIENFLSLHGVTPIYNNDSVPDDIGSVIPVLQRE